MEFLGITFFQWSIISFLALMVIAGLLLLHFLLIQEFVKQNKAQESRIKAMQRQVDIEMGRTMGLNFKNERLRKFKVASPNLESEIKSK